MKALVCKFPLLQANMLMIRKHPPLLSHTITAAHAQFLTSYSWFLCGKATVVISLSEHIQHKTQV